MWISRIKKDSLTNEVIDRLLFEDLNDNGIKAEALKIIAYVNKGVIPDFEI